MSKIRSQHQAEHKNERGTTLCFCLGMFFFFFGLLIASIIKGTDGCKAALKGMIWCLVLYFIAGVVIGFLSCMAK